MTVYFDSVVYSVLLVICLIIFVTILIKNIRGWKQCAPPPDWSKEEEEAFLNERYGSIYRNLLEYLEREKAYLNPDLRLEDVAKALYSNNTYVSKAIALYSGEGGFRVLLNRYRIRHSLDLFMNDKSLTVEELAVRSGFKTERTYRGAFQLYMNMSPREWCKKIKYSSLKDDC